MDAKKFLFLSSAQRWAISLALVALIALCIGVFLWAPRASGLPDFGAASLEILKLLLTAAAAWILVLLYASSNSFWRIEKETVRFLTRDLCRPSRPLAHIDGVPMADLEASAPVKMRRLTAARTSVTYEVVNAEGDRINFWCNLNVNEFACVFMLPAEYAYNYELVYSATLSGFARRGIEITSFGIVSKSFDGQPPQRCLELYLVRTLGPDFLFDAGARVQLAQSLWGDLRSFLVCTARARQAISASGSVPMSEAGNVTQAHH